MPARCLPRSRARYEQKRIHPRLRTDVSPGSNRCRIDCRVTCEGRVWRPDLPTVFRADSIECPVNFHDADAATDLYASGVRPHRPS